MILCELCGAELGEQSSRRVCQRCDRRGCDPIAEAAPDLLAALERVVSLMDEHDGRASEVAEDLDAARAAIAKARGQEVLDD